MSESESVNQNGEMLRKIDSDVVRAHAIYELTENKREVIKELAESAVNVLTQIGSTRRAASILNAQDPRKALELIVQQKDLDTIKLLGFDKSRPEEVIELLCARNDPRCDGYAARLSYSLGNNDRAIELLARTENNYEASMEYVNEDYAQRNPAFCRDLEGRIERFVRREYDPWNSGQNDVAWRLARGAERLGLNEQAAKVLIKIGSSGELVRLNFIDEAIEVLEHRGNEAEAAKLARQNNKHDKAKELYKAFFEKYTEYKEFDVYDDRWKLPNLEETVKIGKEYGLLNSILDYFQAQKKHYGCVPIARVAKELGLRELAISEIYEHFTRPINLGGSKPRHGRCESMLLTGLVPELIEGCIQKGDFVYAGLFSQHENNPLEAAKLYEQGEAFYYAGAVLGEMGLKKEEADVYVRAFNHHKQKGNFGIARRFARAAGLKSKSDPLLELGLNSDVEDWLNLPDCEIPYLPEKYPSPEKFYGLYDPHEQISLDKN